MTMGRKVAPTRERRRFGGGTEIRSRARGESGANSGAGETRDFGSQEVAKERYSGKNKKTQWGSVGRGYARNSRKGSTI